MFQKEGKQLHHGPRGRAEDGEFAGAIATALKDELGSTHQAVKTAMRWTGASERTVKYWFAGTHGPKSEHLVALAKHSDAVMAYILVTADRPHLSIGVHWITVRNLLVELVETIDLHHGL